MSYRIRAEMKPVSEQESNQGWGCPAGPPGRLRPTGRACLPQLPAGGRAVEVCGEAGGWQVLVHRLLWPMRSGEWELLWSFLASRGSMTTRCCACCPQLLAVWQLPAWHCGGWWPWKQLAAGVTSACKPRGRTDSLEPADDVSLHKCMEVGVKQMVRHPNNTPAGFVWMMCVLDVPCSARSGLCSTAKLEKKKEKTQLVLAKLAVETR
ncbi:hypothetical protein HaLaN_11966 [Haematococcus lacustris]|uniref:Uncharacterized protein n=1 Tax=Haematococcus lacustris TaxID=44745 RepID=A0A699ZJ19_HAELA|nr:hypothetical protein HaLaN_11966 [Haematococcus lacustris]